MNTTKYGRPIVTGRAADAYCAECDAPMSGDEAALNYKLIDKKTTRFLCPLCLGKKMGETPEHLHKMITLFRKQGCTLFSPWKDN